MTPSASRFDTAAVRGYYDRQTAGFVALGQGGGEGAIHRAVWGPGVRRRGDAFHFVEDHLAHALGWDGLPERLAAGIESHPPHVLDLGCGVGGSLCHLAARYGIRGTGVTLSPVQAQLASARTQAMGLADRVTCLEGDYTQLPASIAGVDAAFAIESFVHGPSPARFFAECARVLAPGGTLWLCDDLRRPSPDPRAARMLEQFRAGWHINTLIDHDHLVEMAAAAGFTHVETVDLTPWLELGRPRDHAIAALVALGRWLPLHRTRVAHLVGGSALQTCLRRGWVGYELVRLQKP